MMWIFWKLVYICLVSFLLFLEQGNLIARGVIEFCDGGPLVRTSLLWSSLLYTDSWWLFLDIILSCTYIMLLKFWEKIIISSSRFSWIIPTGLTDVQDLSTHLLTSCHINCFNRLKIISPWEVLMLVLHLCHFVV